MADGNLSEAFAWAEKRLERELWPRERQFIETGGLAFPDGLNWKDKKRPENGTDENRFDARLISWLLTNQIPCITCRLEGAAVFGLWIEKTLNLGSVDCRRALVARSCTFNEAPVLRNAQLSGLYLTGSALPGLDAVGLTCHGKIQLNKGFTADACVQLGGTKITGQVDCGGGHFASEKGVALDLSSAVIGADVFMNDGFSAHGAVKLVRVQIAGQLTCDGGRLDATDGHALNCNAAVIGADAFLRQGFAVDGNVNFAGVQVTGNLKCQSASIDGEVRCEGAQIGGGFFWENISGKVELLDLTETQVGRLSDDISSWICVETPKLSGFRYDSIQSDMTVQERLVLLGRKWERDIPSPSSTASSRQDFDPQPYSHLAKVYDTMGYKADAAKVRYAREVRQAKADLIRVLVQKPLILRHAPHRALARLVFALAQFNRFTIGFRTKPFRPLFWMLPFVATAYVLSDLAYSSGEMAPASDVILAANDWQNALADQRACATIPMATTNEPNCIQPLFLWAGRGSVGDPDYLPQSPSARDYETFSACIYAIDLFLPLDTLAQEESWSPSKDRGSHGKWLFYARSIIQLSGWLIFTTVVTMLSGILNKQD